MPLTGITTAIPFIGGLGAFSPLDPNLWLEEVGDKGKREDVVTSGESLCTLRGYVMRHDLLIPALVYWLGYSYVDYNPLSASFLKVKRELPAPHPEYIQLFANRIRVMGWKYRDKIAIPPPVGVFGAKVPFARYDRYYLEIDFGMTDYAVLPDDYIRPFGLATPITEWERFTSITPEDDTEILTVDGGSYIYKDGLATPLPMSMINGPLLRRNVERTELVITVRQLPYDFLFDGYNIPRRLMKAKGKVNSDTFLGFNPETMLLKSWRPVKYPQAVATQTWTQLQFGVDVEFRFSYQEPNKAIASETLAGWNLVPKVGVRWDDGWYGVVHGSSLTPIYSSINMTELMTHWSIPGP